MGISKLAEHPSDKSLSLIIVVLPENILLASNSTESAFVGIGISISNVESITIPSLILSRIFLNIDI